MARLLGVFLLVVSLYAMLYQANPIALSGGNLVPMAQKQGFFVILTLGAGVLIISGGIDLSIGSCVAMSAVIFGTLCEKGVPPLLALLAVLLIGAGIGLIHGLLVTMLRLQPFLVTLCGLFVYRGLARYFAGDATVGYDTVKLSLVDAPGSVFQLGALREVALGTISLFGIPLPTILLLALALVVVVGVFLHGSVHGRYLFALGGNEEAARYAGVPVMRYKILAYVFCSTLASLGGVLEFLMQSTVQPASTGEFYELYAITGAVLGGCSLSGGDGNVVGILLGTFVLPVLSNMTIWLRSLPGSLQPTIIGVVLLLGTIADEWFKRRASRKG